jgi:hypothetical protein
MSNKNVAKVQSFYGGKGHGSSVPFSSVKTSILRESLTILRKTIRPYGQNDNRMLDTTEKKPISVVYFAIQICVINRLCSRMNYSSYFIPNGRRNNKKN